MVCSTDIKSRTAKKVLRHLLTVTTLLLVTDDNIKDSSDKKNYDIKQLTQIQKIIIDVLNATVGKSQIIPSWHSSIQIPTVDSLQTIPKSLGKDFLCWPKSC